MRSILFKNSIVNGMLLLSFGICLNDTLINAQPCSGNVEVKNVKCFAEYSGSATGKMIGGAVPIRYSWSTGATTQSITGLHTGTYSVTMTDKTGCSVSSLVTVSEPKAIYTVAASISTTKGEKNGSVSVSVSGGTPGYSYSWSPGGATTRTAHGLSSAKYTVTVTDGNGCTQKSSIAVDSAQTAVKNYDFINMNMSFNAYFNPSAKTITVATTNTSQYILKLFDITGKCAQTITFNNNTQTIDVSGLSSGIYTIELIDKKNRGVGVKKISV